MKPRASPGAGNPSTKPIAIFSDSNMLPGLHVTLATALKSLSPERSSEVVFHIFLDRVSESEKELLQKTFRKFNKASQLRLIDFQPDAPESSDPLHGNQTTYGRLHLAELLADFDACVYLDADLYVNRCVCDIFDEINEDYVLFVSGIGTREYTLDRELYERIGLNLKGACFNAGVMGINLRLWRQRGFATKCIRVAKKYSGLIKNADQTLLNIALHDAFLPLEASMNRHLYPRGGRVTEAQNELYHFVGSPKPWDFLGQLTSNHYRLWKDVYDETAIGKKSYLRYSSIRRMGAISKSSIKALLVRKST